MRLDLDALIGQTLFQFQNFLTNIFQQIAILDRDPIDLAEYRFILITDSNDVTLDDYGFLIISRHRGNCQQSPRLWSCFQRQPLVQRIKFIYDIGYQEPIAMALSLVMHSSLRRWVLRRASSPLIQAEAPNKMPRPRLHNSNRHPSTHPPLAGTRFDPYFLAKTP